MKEILIPWVLPDLGPAWACAIKRPFSWLFVRALVLLFPVRLSVLIIGAAKEIPYKIV